jgi:hypothetical protein
LGRQKTGAKVETAIRARPAAGDGIKKVAKTVGVGNGTASRIKAATTPPPFGGRLGRLAIAVGRRTNDRMRRLASSRF